MFYGRNEFDEYVIASQKTVGQEIYCPNCNSKMTTKRSHKGRYFFTHTTQCSGGEGDAHLFWKDYVAHQLQRYGAKQEVQLENMRRADILVGKIAVEIQLSNIGIKVIKERVNDYFKLGLQQYWIFKMFQRGEYLTLTPMAMYIWRNTSLPLLYIDFKTKHLVYIQSLQIINKNKAIYEAKQIPWDELLYLKREYVCTSQLQKRWKIERKRYIQQFYKEQIHYRTKLKEELYYLKAYGFTIECFGRAYTANNLFAVSPFVWQIHLVYIKCVKKYTFQMCCDSVKEMMITKHDIIAEQITLQVLEQFLAVTERK